MQEPTAMPTQSSRRSAFLFAFFALVLSNVIMALVIYGFSSGDVIQDDMNAPSSHHASVGSCNVRGIELHGELYTYLPAVAQGNDPYDGTASQDFVDAVRAADADDSVKAILVDIDSPGGGPVAGEEASNALRNASKPVVAVIREQGDSAAYWAATGADMIFASANSDVGSIGVTSSYIDNSEQNTRDGLQYVELSSGKFKDTGSPDKPLTPAEKELILRDVKIVHQNFVADVAKNRNLTVEQVAALADGSSMTGQMALEKKLIDRIGSFAEAEDYLSEQIDDDVEVCW